MCFGGSVIDRLIFIMIDYAHYKDRKSAVMPTIFHRAEKTNFIFTERN